VRVLDESSSKTLFVTRHNSVPGRNILVLDFSAFVQKGVFSFKVVIEDKESTQEYPVTFKPKAIQ
jgi:hypothetical protein